jgi:hypothetical protein
MRLVRLIATAATVMTLVGPVWPGHGDPPSPGGAVSGQSPAAGWTIGDGPHPTLTWRASKRITMGDAKVEFYAGRRLLGRPGVSRDQRTFSLAIGGMPPSALTDLRVVAGGRRLDGGTESRPSRRTGPNATGSSATVRPANSVDPGLPGLFGTSEGEYDLAPVTLPDLPVPVEMKAVVVAPVNAPGPRPLVLMLHGQHDTCFQGADEDSLSAEWPCPAGTEPVPSYRGYLPIQRLLASQGYVTVSISANGVNAQDIDLADGGTQARSSLVRLHLALWAGWAAGDRASAPAVVRAAPPADMSRVLLMGHSRGGEGVSRAAMDSLNPPPSDDDGYPGPVRWTIRGLLLIAPTAFDENPVPDVPSVSILPGCDGDVSDLDGQTYVDETREVSRGDALHSALYVIGANHNFFNTEWTPGLATAPASDDFPADVSDPVCTPGISPTRLTATQEQHVGATYAAAAARLFLSGDDRVRPLLDGTGNRAPSADPARVLSAAIGDDRRPAFIPGTGAQISGARLCDEVSLDETTSCLDLNDDTAVSPNFLSIAYPEPDRYAVAMNWSAPGQTVTLSPAKPVSLAGADALALRIIVPPNTTGTRFRVSATTTDGRQSVLGEVGVDGLPGSDYTTSYWAQEVRVPLAGIDLTRVASVELTPLTASGQAWLLDAWGWRAGTPPWHRVALPRVDLGELRVAEGDSGTRTYDVPVQITGAPQPDERIRFFLTDEHSGDQTSWVATVGAGSTSVPVPVSVTGNTRWSNDRTYSLLAKAIHHVTVGNVQGDLTVANDDPLPSVTVAPVAATATWGTALTWRVTLSTPVDDPVGLFATAQPPADAPELSSTDVDPQWLATITKESPLPSRPLSSVKTRWLGATPGFRMHFAIQPGSQTADITIPTVATSDTGSTAHVQLQISTAPAMPVPTDMVTGVVDG